MYSYIPSQKEIFDDIYDQRLIQIKKGILISYQNEQVRILPQQFHNKSKECERFKQFLEKRNCLGIYTGEGNLVSKIQPYQFVRSKDQQDSFTITSDSVEHALNQRNRNLYRAGNYYIDTYRNAPDYAYKTVLSQKMEYFQEHKFCKSEYLLSYIKGQISQLKTDSMLQFNADKRLKNKGQIDAINRSGRQMALIIEGPAGVGKSLVGCKIAIQYCLKKKKVILVTVTNVGAKSLCEHLVQQLGNDGLQNHRQNSILLRLLKALAKVKSQITSPNIQQKMIEILDKQIKERIREMKKQEKINFLYFNLLLTLEEYFCMQPYLRYYSFNTRLIINLVELTNYQIPVLQILANLNKIASKILVLDSFKQLYLKAVRYTIANANIIVTSTAKAAQLNRYQQTQESKFKPYVAIFDEAAQATLADTYCILSLDIKRIVLIGDEKQLAPIKTGDYESLKFTILSIMKNKPRSNPIKFAYQYRMNHEIAKLVSFLTYGDEVKNGFKKNKKVSNIQGYFAYPVFMVTHNIQQEMPQSMHQYGYYNIQQIKMIKLYIDQFPDEQLKDIGIVTTYKAQVRRMKEVFKNEIKLGLSISTVDGYQGAEKDYIFFSVVRSNYSGKLGFSEDKNRVNVALSRAKVGLVVVGNLYTLSLGNYDNPWKSVIDYLMRIDSVFHFPQDLLKRADESYFFRRPRDMSKQVEAQQAFEVDQDYYEVGEKAQKIKQKQLFEHQTEELPFIISNYN